MKYRIITDKEYVTFPTDRLMKIQDVLDSCALLITVLSRCDIKDNIVKSQIQNSIECFKVLNDDIEESKPKTKPTFTVVE